MPIRRAAVCVLAACPVLAARAEIVLDAPPPIPPAPAAPVVRAVHEAAVAPEVAIAEPAPSRVSAGAFSDRLKLKDGRELTGDFVSFAPEAGVAWRRRAFPRPVVFALDAVARIDLNQTVPKAGASEPQMILFADGSSLPGKVEDFSADKIVVATWFAGKVGAKTSAVRRFGVVEEKSVDPREEIELAQAVFAKARNRADRDQAMTRLQAAYRALENGRRKPKPPPPEKIPPGVVRVRLANGDKLHATAFTVHEGKAQVKMEAGPLAIPMERIRSCEWADAPAAGEAAARKPGFQAVHLNGPLGGTLVLRLESIGDGKLTGVSESLGRLEVALDAVAAIEP